MKKLILFTALLVSFLSSAQKFGIVDTEYILDQLPEYKKAQQEIEKISMEEQKKIEKMHQSLDSMVRVFQREEVLLTEELKLNRKTEISKKELEIKEYQKKIFGYQGRIFLKRQELIQPIQNKVYGAIEKVAKKQKLQVIFDKSGDLTIIYANKVHDYTDIVLEMLSLGDPKDTIDNKRSTNNN